MHTTRPAPHASQVSKVLRAAGFRVALYSDSGMRRTGARVHEWLGNVEVAWYESHEDAERRLIQLGLPTTAALPPHPLSEERVREYAAVLDPRYAVTVEQAHDGRWYARIGARKELPARTRGLPTTSAVRKALAPLSASVLDQRTHVRIATTRESDLAPIRDALTAHGWTFEELPPGQWHYLLHITGAAPDRAERLRTLRAATSEQPPAAPVEPAAPQAEDTPSHTPAAPAPPVRPALPCYRSDTGHTYRVGGRATYRTRDGFWRHGKITEVRPACDGDARTMVVVEVDATQVAPRLRAPKGVPNAPGRRRSQTPPLTVVVPLDDKNLTPEILTDHRPR